MFVCLSNVEYLYMNSQPNGGMNMQSVSITAGFMYDVKAVTPFDKKISPPNCLRRALN